MASSDNHGPSWVDPSNDEKDEEKPLMGSGDVKLQDCERDVEAATTPTKEQDSAGAATYGALDKDTNEKSEQQVEWHEEQKQEPVKTKKKRTRKKSVQIKESIHEILVNRPHRSFCQHVFIFVQIVAVLSSISLLMTQIIPIVIAPPNQVGYLQFALRLYISCFCVSFVLVESDLKVPFLKDSKILNNWISRGFLYSFVALIGMEEAYSERVEELVGNANDRFHVAWVPTFMQISSYLMLSTGYIYMVMGLCCLKRLRSRLNDNYQQRLKEYREAKAAPLVDEEP